MNPIAAPLADRLRPRTLDEFVGQEHIVGPGRLLRRAIQADQLASVIFAGPPGTGKTTLARVIANSTQGHFISINAVLAGVKEIRAAVETAQERRDRHNQRTILFVDEVHRFNKSQQDALLPWVENGTVILIGATTENPYFEVNKALVSRSRIFQLKSLTAADLVGVVYQALTDAERGYGDRAIQLDPEALDHLVNVANGDARSLLNALELAVETTTPDRTGMIRIDLAVAEESIQQRAVLYDKEGDAHFDIISAFIKSLRGSDPDAALYWLARMVYAGEDPRFIFRRMLILASEDVGLADPEAVARVNACAATFDRVGMPEGRYPLAQAALYLATAPKSNSVMGFFDALAAVEREREADVPSHLKDANRDKHSFGHGANYLYPHAYRDHWVAQQYLPAALQGQVFYQPSEQGFEAGIRTQVERRREAQLAAIAEGLDVTAPEILTYSPTNKAQERWLQRTLSQTGERLAQVRDHLFEMAQPQRHHTILELNGGNGLLTWEALRRVPEGGVYVQVPTSTDVERLQAQVEALPELLRPTILQGPVQQLPALLTAQAPDIRFDHIVGRNVLMAAVDRPGLIHVWVSLLQSGGQITLAETMPRHSQRLYRLLDPAHVEPDLYQRLVTAEEAVYADTSDPKMSWDHTDLKLDFEQAGCRAQTETVQTIAEMYISAALIERWFAIAAYPPTYANHLSHYLSELEINWVGKLFQRYLQEKTVSWVSTIAFVQAEKSLT
ncbi:AAA family ATPase [Trichocoleus desertorum AS-A10]|uniref:AAA family ATPase n=1 Tax=Trichocoleus desertorum TaxID=1481672 RepID=UPI003298F8EE